MALLKCDVCGGKIIVQSGGAYGVCESCGANYTLERMREIASGIKVSVTGTKEDVEQWKSLLKTYLSTHDFEAAEKTTKKILEAVPDDIYANEIYSKLGDWKYHDIRNGILVKYNGRSCDITIPDGISEIGEGAFEDYKNLVTLSLPNSLSKINNRAFKYCCNLTHVTIPDSVAFVGNEAFSGCSALSEVLISNNVKHIGDKACSSCSSLSKIIIPDSVTFVGRLAFSGCHNLVSLSLSKQLREINSGTFSYCSKLNNVILPEGLVWIGNDAFAHCQNLVSITIPCTCTKVGARAFECCINLSKVIVLGRNTEFQEYNDDHLDRTRHVFSDCKKLTSITYPDGCGYTLSAFYGTPYADKERERRKEMGLCIVCGGEIRGIFNRVCSVCGQKQY